MDDLSTAHNDLVKRVEVLEQTLAELLQNLQYHDTEKAARIAQRSYLDLREEKLPDMPVHSNVTVTSGLTTDLPQQEIWEIVCTSCGAKAYFMSRDDDDLIEITHELQKFLGETVPLCR